MAEYKNCEALSEYFREKFEYYKAKSEIKVCDGYMYDEKMQYAAIVAKHFLDELKRIPTADVVPVVRCKDCKHCEHIYPECDINGNCREAYYCKSIKGDVKPDDYCCWGERR